MNRQTLVALAALLAAFAVEAAEPVTAAAKPAQSVAAKPAQTVAAAASASAPAVPQKAVAPQKTAATDKAVVPQKTAASQGTAVHSQQNKMRECNKQATGKKGAERKAFMKTCLSKKA